MGLGEFVDFQLFQNGQNCYIRCSITTHLVIKAKVILTEFYSINNICVERVDKNIFTIKFDDNVIAT